MMIKIFTGDDRIKATEQIREFLGEDYEVIEGSEVLFSELANIFFGTSLFGAERKILIRDLAENKAVFDELEKYLETPHKIALFETKLDKRTSTYKAIKGKVEILEFKKPVLKFNPAFNIYDVAKNDGARAVKMLKEIEMEEEPIQFCGLMAYQALKDYKNRQGERERRNLKKLAKLDLDLKSSGIDAWCLVEAFLLSLK